LGHSIEGRTAHRVQAEKAKASFKNGILEVRLPKTEVAKAKEIKVAVEEGPITSVGQN
jgi:HSP20 family molecular chaperone IbpA